MEDFKNNLERLQTKMKELQELRSEVEIKRATFERKVLDQRLLLDEELLPLDQSIHDLSQECGELGEQIVSVRLVDLVYELARLTGINVSQMGISVSTNVAFWGKYSKEDMVAMCKTDNLPTSKHAYSGEEKVEITIKEYKDSTNRDNTFYFHISFPLDFEAIQGDGKTLLEHCNVKREYDDVQGAHYTRLLINRNIEDILCIIKLEDLVAERLWLRPAGLFRKAVINCLTKDVKVKRLGK